LRLLERRTSRLGKNAVDHPKGGHDDYANSVAGALIAASQPGFRAWTGTIDYATGAVIVSSPRAAPRPNPLRAGPRGKF
jgi:hypothetical protein